MSTFKFVKQLGFGSIINFVNVGENGTVDEDRLNIILAHMFNNGWRELTLDEIDIIVPSTQFRYLLKDDEGIKFRTGGFFINYYLKEDDPELTDSYILYSSHIKGVNATAQYSTLYKIYTYQKPKKDIIKLGKRIKYKKPTNKTKYPVCMQDVDGNIQTVYFARSSKERETFMSTNKFKNAMKNGWEFLD